MDVTSLRQDIDANPELSSAMAANDLQFIVDKYAEDHPLLTVPSKFMLNKRVLYAEIGMFTALPIIVALEDLASAPDRLGALMANEVLLLLNDLSPNGGVDISHPEARAMIDQLVARGILAQDLADQVKAMGEVHATKGFAMFGENVTLEHVQQAQAL